METNRTQNYRAQLAAEKAASTEAAKVRNTLDAPNEAARIARPDGLTMLGTHRLPRGANNGYAAAMGVGAGAWVLGA